LSPTYPLAIATQVAIVKVRVKIMLRTTVSRPVCLGVRRQSVARVAIFITARHLRGCGYGEPTLTRRRVCSLHQLLGVASAFSLGYESLRTEDSGPVLLSQICDAINLEDQVPYYIPPEHVTQ
jgi:hypothetical protein